MELRETVVNGVALRESGETLCLSTDALLLSAFIRKNGKAHALELGAGSGVISLLLAKRGAFRRITAVEIQKELARLCGNNVTNNGFSDVIDTKCADVRELSQSVIGGVSVIYANPPYMEVGRGRESESHSRNVARHEVCGGMREFTDCAGRLLKTGGRYYTVYRPDRLETLFASLKENRLSPKRMTFVTLDAEHSPSSVLTEAVKDGSQSLFLTPVLYLKKPDGSDSENAKFIYENGVFPSEFFRI